MKATMITAGKEFLHDDDGIDLIIQIEIVYINIPKANPSTIKIIIATINPTLM